MVVHPGSSLPGCSYPLSPSSCPQLRHRIIEHHAVRDFGEHLVQPFLGKPWSRQAGPARCPAGRDCSPRLGPASPRQSVAGLGQKCPKQAFPCASSPDEDEPRFNQPRRHWQHFLSFSTSSILVVCPPCLLCGLSPSGAGTLG